MSACPSLLKSPMSLGYVLKLLYPPAFLPKNSTDFTGLLCVMYNYPLLVAINKIIFYNNKIRRMFKNYFWVFC